jgi:ketosteroid isomerase-like protein
VDGWLARYKRAWETYDADLVVSLFTPMAHYYERPFQPPLIGHDAIRRYWEGIAQTQRCANFTYTIIAARAGAGAATWQATFTRVPSGQRRLLDGVMALEFNRDGLCAVLREWWHSKEA